MKPPQPSFKHGIAAWLLLAIAGGGLAGQAATIAGPQDEPLGKPEPIELALDGAGWQLDGEGAKVEELAGETALRLISGIATYRDIEFLDGTIEFDLRVTAYRSFAYLYFRMVDGEEHEEIYFRPHKSMLPDAVQYTPVYKGSSQWQLYHDGGATAAAPLPPDEWIHVKLIVSGTRAAVFVGAGEEPRLVIPRLAREPAAGYLALRSFRPFGVPPDTYLANFANVVVRPGVVEYPFPATEAASDPTGRIEEWRLSPAFVPPEGALLELPAQILAALGWQTATANDNGLVEIERYLERPEGARRAAMLARLRIRSDEAVTRRLRLGFSDEVSIFLNGRLLVSDDDSYSFNLPRRQGLLSDDQLSIYLPLEEGENELIVAVTDRFGGWGLAGRFDDLAGLTIEAR